MDNKYQNQYKENLDSFSIYKKQINNFPLLSKEEIKNLFIELNDKKISEERKNIITNKIIEANLRLVLKEAFFYFNKYNTGLDIKDLVQYGNEGLIRAVEKFEIQQGFLFSTYAHPWIKSFITRGIQKSGKAVKIPAAKYEEINKMQKIKNVFFEKHQKYPTIEELSSLMEIDVIYLKKLFLYQKVRDEMIYIDKSIDESNNNDISSIIADEKTIVFKEDITKEEFKDEIEDIFSVILTDREEYIIVHSFGLFGKNLLSAKEIADNLNLTTSRIHQIQKKSLKKLKDSRYSEKLLKVLKSYL